jgi:ABC-2 type transport system permease protein
MRQYIQVVVIHLKEIIRTPGIIFWGIGFPVLMAWGLGLAFTQAGELRQNVAIDTAVNWEEVVPDFRAKGINEDGIKIGNAQIGYTHYQFFRRAWDAALIDLKRGKIDLIVGQENGALKYHFDPQNPEAQMAYLHLQQVFYGQNLYASDYNIEPMTQQGTRYIDFLIPGLVAMGVMMSCMWGISYNLIDKRAKKLMRRMVATPMNRSTFLAGMLTARLVLNFVEAVVLILFAWWAFDVVIQGSLLGLTIIFVSGNIVFSGIAMFISSRIQTTEVGNGLINLVVMPMMILSGIFFSYQSFPDWAIQLIQLLPLTSLADVTRGIYNEGFGLAEVVQPALLMNGFGLGFFFAGLKMFRWY